MYVYKTTNLINNKIYIGISKKASSENIRYLGSGKSFKKAVAKYGRDNFKKEIIIEDINFTYKDLQRLEVFLIDIFDARDNLIGYNISIGGDGNVGESNGMFGKTHSKETVAKILETRLHNSKDNSDYGKRSEDTSAKFSKFIIQRNITSPTLPNGHSEKSKLQISETLKQMAIEGNLHKNHAKFTEERKEEYSKKFSGENNPMFGKNHTSEAIDKLKEAIRLRFPPINKIDRDGEIIKEYESITDVALDGYRPDLVKKVLRGENKTHGGFYWEYPS